MWPASSRNFRSPNSPETQPSNSRLEIERLRRGCRLAAGIMVDFRNVIARIFRWISGNRIVIQHTENFRHGSSLQHIKKVRSARSVRRRGEPGTVCGELMGRGSFESVCYRRIGAWGARARARDSSRRAYGEPRAWKRRRGAYQCRAAGGDNPRAAGISGCSLWAELEALASTLGSRRPWIPRSAHSASAVAHPDARDALAEAQPHRELQPKHPHLAAAPALVISFAEPQGSAQTPAEYEHSPRPQHPSAVTYCAICQFLI